MPRSTTRSRTPRNSASTSTEFTLNWPAILARKTKIVNKHAKGIEFLFRKNKVETMRVGAAGRARDAYRRKRRQITEVEAKNIMFATGSEARTLPGVEIDGKVDPRQQGNSESAGSARNRW